MNCKGDLVSTEEMAQAQSNAVELACTSPNSD